MYSFTIVPRRLWAELGISYAAFQQVNPSLVMCSITPFGLTGPYKDYRAYELNLAMGAAGPGSAPEPQIGRICLRSRLPATKLTFRADWPQP